MCCRRLKYRLIYIDSSFLSYLLIRTRRLVHLTFWMVLHPLYSLVHLLERVITIRFEFAHRAVIGVHGDLFFVTDLEQGGMLLHNLDRG